MAQLCLRSHDRILAMASLLKSCNCAVARVRRFQRKKTHSRNAGIPGIIPRNSVPDSGTPPPLKKNENVK